MFVFKLKKSSAPEEYEMAIVGSRIKPKTVGEVFAVVLDWPHDDLDKVEYISHKFYTCD